MGASDALSPRQLKDHVKALVDSNAEVEERGSGDKFRIPELAHNSHSRCGDASETVEEHLAHRGVETKGLSFSTHVPWMSNHYATEVNTSKGPHVVDLAYSQYEDNDMVPKEKRAPWPLVEPKQRYLKRTGFQEDQY